MWKDGVMRSSIHGTIPSRSRGAMGALGLENGNWKLETRTEPEIGNRKLAQNWDLETGNWKLETRAEPWPVSIFRFLSFKEEERCR